MITHVSYSVARSIKEIDLLNRLFLREKIPATAYRCGSKTVVAFDSETLSDRQRHEMVGLALDRDLKRTWARNLPPRVIYLVESSDGGESVAVVARAAHEALAQVPGARSAIPAWL